MRIVILNDENSDFAGRGSIPKHGLSQSGGVTLGGQGATLGGQGVTLGGQGGRGDGRRGIFREEKSCN